MWEQRRKTEHAPPSCRPLFPLGEQCLGVDFSGKNSGRSPRFTHSFQPRKQRKERAAAFSRKSPFLGGLRDIVPLPAVGAPAACRPQVLPPFRLGRPWACKEIARLQGGCLLSAGAACAARHASALAPLVRHRWGRAAPSHSRGICCMAAMVREPQCMLWLTERRTGQLRMPARTPCLLRLPVPVLGCRQVWHS